MPLVPANGVRDVLADVNGCGTIRLQELIEETDRTEVVTRREVDRLALDGHVKRLYIGDHIILKKTERFKETSRKDVTAPVPERAGQG